ncbi:MAG: MFS transporter [Rhodospirillaceae bacterium]
MDPTSSAGASISPQHPYPSRWLVWSAMCLLASAQIMSFIDRFVLSLLIAPIKQALALSDFQIGLLLGPAFAICFAVFGVPMGWLADRKNRTTIIASGIVLWSAMTAACGLARSFGALFVARIGVGLGEAALNPSVVSLVSDYFPRDRRSRAMGFYMTSAFIGAGTAYILGGQAVQIIASWPPLSLPLIGDLMAWQTAFIVISTPGFIIAALIFLTPEPSRRGTPGNAVNAMSFSQAYQHFSLNWRPYTCVFIGMAGTTAISAASFWSPALFERAWGWNVDRTGLVIGLVILLGGIPGANLGGWLSDRFTRHRADGPLLTCLIGSIVMFPGFALYPLMPSGELAAALMWLAFFGLAMCAGVSPNAVAAITPSGLKAQAAGWFFMTMNLLGLFLGPPLVGFVADQIAGPAGLRYAMAISFFIFGAGTIGVLRWGLKPYRLSAQETAQKEN